MNHENAEDKDATQELLYRVNKWTRPLLPLQALSFTFGSHAEYLEMVLKYQMVSLESTLLRYYSITVCVA